MVRDRELKTVQPNTIVQYTVPVPGPQEKGSQANMAQEAADYLQGTTEILAAIQGSKQALETKMEAMSMDINHLPLDLHKVAERVTTTKEDVVALNRENKDCQATVAWLKCSATQVEESMEDAEGHSRRNNLCFLGFP
ncbi:hypothetical protein NDU88_007288 [Pleurodeles waltl]|uniref:Uncharacterized protein n=1 Tax=Pleurodeles waltl TaxID=8319 RepID=A0AAV7NWA4_PLEWA|nr:hypothetical protein NDU88_007288 [Pleurodeles waltl]